jgi:RNA polymerase sigma-70 factor (ECF subfamily)
MPPLSLVRGSGPPRPRASAHEIDGEILSRAQRGDDDACRAIVECYQGRIFAVVGRTLGIARAARLEDVCQECFLKVFGALRRFDPEGPAKLSTWILTIATRLCLDELRSRQRFLHDELSDDLAAPALTEPVALERALRRRIERALASLPPELRATFALRVTAELSVADTARALGVDEGTVKSRLSRARERLRAEIGEV